MARDDDDDDRPRRKKKRSRDDDDVDEVEVEVEDDDDRPPKKRSRDDDDDEVGVSAGEPPARKRSRVDDVVAEGDRVVIRWSGGGTHRGELFGIPPTQKSITANGIHIFRIADGKIAEHWGTSDDLGMMRQLGVIPAPGG